MKLNELNLDKTLRVSHIDCDGIVPIILDKFFQIPYAYTICTNYGEDLELESLQSGIYETVIYTDFTPSELCQKEIIDKGINCIILDHHIASKEEMEKFCNDYDKAEYIFDNEKCGTKIYYEWLKEQGYKGNDVSDYIVKLTDTYDLYKQDDENWNMAEQCNRLLYATALWSYKTDRLKAYEFFINTMLWKMQNADHFFFNNLENTKIMADVKKENEIFENLIKNAPTEISTRKDSKGNYFAVFNCNSKISAVANRLLKKYSKLTYCIIINEYDKENPRISLRSKDDFDLLTLNYTSGHSNACGIDNEKVEDMKDFTKKLKSKEIYELGYVENNDE